MAGGNRPLTREQELGDAIETAQLPARDYRIYRTLLRRAQWKSAVILDQFQPRSLDELAAWSRISKAGLKDGLNHLTRHGWLNRHRNITATGIGGRGHGTKYELLAGRDCDCSKAAKDWPVPATKGARNHALKGPGVGDVSPGQGHVSAKRVREEGGVVEVGLNGRVLAEPGQSLNGCAVCGTPMDPVLPWLGYGTHPNCDPHEIPEKTSATTRS